MLYLSAALLCCGFTGVCRCRAAVRRCGVETSSALQIASMFCEWHQTKARAHRNGLSRNELSSLYLPTGTTLGHANPLSMRLSQCPHLSQSKCRYPEASRTSCGALATAKPGGRGGVEMCKASFLETVHLVKFLRAGVSRGGVPPLPISYVLEL